MSKTAILDGFAFNAATHRYTLNDKALPGVSTIVRILDKPALLQWAANMAVDYLAKVEQPKPEDYEAARYAWQRTRDKAGVKGTDVHALIEDYVKMCLLENEGHPLPKDANEDSIKSFITWARDNDIRFLDCEVMQYSEEHWFAGRFDLLYEMKGEVWLGDIKTSKGVYAEAYIQLGGYDIMCAERGVKVDHRAVLHLPKDELTVHPSFDRQRDTEAFLACLKLYKTLKSFGTNNYNKQ